MSRIVILRLPLALAIVGTIGPAVSAAEPTEPFLQKLPPGVFLTSSVEAPAGQLQAIGNKLGGELRKVTNSVVQVHGRPIQVNAITTADAASAKAVHAALAKIKPPEYCLLKDLVVIEYVLKDADLALATKTSYELGFVKKPESVRYRVVAEIATVDKADYMSCNPLFNHFLALPKAPNQDVARQIEELSKKFAFGKSLALANPKLGYQTASYAFTPAAKQTDEKGAIGKYVFDDLPKRQGVPYVTATLEITTNCTGLTESSTPPAKSLTAATPFWPAADPAIVELAKKIIAGQTTADGKAAAIVAWLAPGQNVKYSGQTGSRYGVAKVLEQKFGHCWDFSDCFVTLARAAGLPSRQVAGWLYGTSGHVWAELYREGKGWQQVDPTGGGQLRCGIYHIPYFVTDDGEMPIVYVSMPKIEMLTAK